MRFEQITRSRWMVAVAAGLVLSMAAACGDDGSSEGSTAASSAGASVTTPSSGGDDVEFETASGDVRGFDGQTLKVASIGTKAQAPSMEWGVRARIERANADNEIPGVTIEYEEYADDKADPAITLSEARRLVSSVGVFAIVGNFSRTNPGDYFAQEEVPYIGAGLDPTHCSEDGEPSTDVWGFGHNGCQVPSDPPSTPDDARALYAQVKQTTGKDHPTVAIISGDNDSGKESVDLLVPPHEGVGFEVVYAKASVPTATPVSDYTPYVQQLLAADNGNPPDAIVCRMAIECIQLWAGIKSAGFEGTFQHYLYSDLLAQPMAGSFVQTYQQPLNSDTPGMEQLRSDVAAVSPETTIDGFVVSGYVSADMFITALKSLAEMGTDHITPANVQKVLSTITYELDGVTGELRYPESTVVTTPLCAALLESDGTAWKVVQPFECSETQYPAG